MSGHLVAMQSVPFPTNYALKPNDIDTTNRASTSENSASRKVHIPLVSLEQPEFVSIQMEKPLVRKRTFKIIVLGDSGVGKTCLTYKFCQGKFPAQTEATVGVDFREKIIQVANESIKIQIWDTAGQERFRKSMVPHYYRNVHAVIFVYDVTRRSTFENILSWMVECELHNPGREVPAVLVGNKNDAAAHLREVHTNIAANFARLHEMEFFETSAKKDSWCPETPSNDGLCCHGHHTVESVFVTLVCKLLLLRTGLTPTPEDGRRFNLVEMRPVVVKRNDECSC